MFTFEKSGIKIPLPSIEVSETDEGWGKVDVLNGKQKHEESKSKENLQLMKTVNNLKELETAYQKSSEELALEKNKHADTIAQNNKNREMIMEYVSKIDALEKNILLLTKQKDDLAHESSENINLLQAQETYLNEIRKRLNEVETVKDKGAQTQKELARSNEILKKSLEEIKNQLAKMAVDNENNQITFSKEIKYLQNELKQKTNELARKTELLEKARADNLKLSNGRPPTKGSGYNTRKKDIYSAEEAQSRSIIKYNKRG